MCRVMCGTSGNTKKDRAAAYQAAREAAGRRLGVASPDVPVDQVTSNDYRAAAVRFGASADGLPRDAALDPARQSLREHATVCRDLGDAMDMDARQGSLF